MDVSAAIGADGFVTLAVVNVHEKQSFAVQLDGLGASDVDVHTVTGKEVTVSNSEGSEEVGIKESKWDGKGKFEFPKHSLTMLRWRP